MDLVFLPSHTKASRIEPHLNQVSVSFGHLLSVGAGLFYDHLERA